MTNEEKDHLIDSLPQYKYLLPEIISSSNSRGLRTGIYVLSSNAKKLININYRHVEFTLYVGDEDVDQVLEEATNTTASYPIYLIKDITRIIPFSSQGAMNRFTLEQSPYLSDEMLAQAISIVSNSTYSDKEIVSEKGSLHELSWDELREELQTEIKNNILDETFGTEMPF